VTKTVLILLVVLIAVTPVTENIWANDNFLHGHDTETTLALVLTFVSFALLGVETAREKIDDFLRRIKGCLIAIFSGWWYPALFTPCSSYQFIVLRNRGIPKYHAGFQLPLLI
jgi:hypothetical protein